MKMRWFDRLILIFAALFLMAQAVLVSMLALDYGREAFDFWTNAMLTHPVNRVLLCVIAVALFVIALRILLMRARKDAGATPDTIFMLSTDAGSVRITVAAIEAIVQRASRGNAKVRDVRARIYSQENSLRVALHTMFTPDANVKEASVALQATVKAALEENTGIPVQEVQLVVEALPLPSVARVE